MVGRMDFNLPRVVDDVRTAGAAVSSSGVISVAGKRGLEGSSGLSFSVSLLSRKTSASFRAPIAAYPMNTERCASTRSRPRPLIRC